MRGKGGEPRHAWLRYMSFAGLLQSRIDLRPQFFIAVLGSEKIIVFLATLVCLEKYVII